VTGARMADDEARQPATSTAATKASIARLEALANVAAATKASEEDKAKDEDKSTPADPEDAIENGCRLAYSSLLNLKEGEDAQALLSTIFTDALLRNPAKLIGGVLFYDEQTGALVQVLEGPAEAVRSLFHEKIARDARHTSVNVLWDVEVEHRRFSGFGMKLGSDPTQVLSGPAATETANELDLLQLAYVSQMTASSTELAYKDIEDILRVAIVTNPKLSIGGVLYLNPRTLHVLQVLEGPQDAVRPLYDKIIKDPRHKACKVVSESKVEVRTYDQWGMLQGDLADWTTLQKGGWMNFEGMSSLPRRTRRFAKEQTPGV